MATIDTYRPAPTTNVVSSVLGQLISWNDRRVTRKMLNNLTDRELSDIGLERADIATWSRR